MSIFLVHLYIWTLLIQFIVTFYSLLRCFFAEVSFLISLNYPNKAIWIMHKTSNIFFGLQPSLSLLIWFDPGMLHSLGMMVVSPGGAVMVTGMWMALLLRPAWLALVEFFWLSASSCFSPRLRLLRIGCKGLEARPLSSASACLSLGEEMWILSQASLHSAVRALRAFSAKWDPCEKSLSALLGDRPQLMWQQTRSRLLLPWYLNTQLYSFVLHSVL